MHFRAITRIVGLLVILFSGTMILPGLIALIYRDGAGRAFTQTFFVALAIGSLLWPMASNAGIPANHSASAQATVSRT